jgi:hypothetical protein
MFMTSPFANAAILLLLATVENSGPAHKSPLVHGPFQLDP